MSCSGHLSPLRFQAAWLGLSMWPSLVARVANIVYGIFVLHFWFPFFFLLLGNKNHLAGLRISLQCDQGALSRSSSATWRAIMSQSVMVGSAVLAGAGVSATPLSANADADLPTRQTVPLMRMRWPRPQAQDRQCKELSGGRITEW